MYKNCIKIDKVISQAAKHYHLEKAMHKHKAVKHWEKTVIGFFPEAEGQTKAVDLKNGVLVVACLSKELAYQIMQLAKRIIEALNQLIGKAIVFALKIET